MFWIGAVDCTSLFMLLVRSFLVDSALIVSNMTNVCPLSVLDPKTNMRRTGCKAVDTTYRTNRQTKDNSSLIWNTAYDLGFLGRGSGS